MEKIDVSDFPDLADRLSDPPIMGQNVKALMRLKSRFWQDYGSSPTLSQDGRVDLTLETTESERKKEFVMVGFSGTKDAKECIDWLDNERERRYIEDLSAVYPRLDRAIDRFEFKNWPSEKWTMASYYFPHKGEVLKWGPFWTAGYEGWLTSLESTRLSLS